MGTRWKKGKVICSFAVFFIGMTMLFVNLIPAVSLYFALGGQAFQNQIDYQESEEFRWLVSERLSDLISVATGGKGWTSGEAVTFSNDYGYYDSGFGGYTGWLDQALNGAPMTAVAEEVVIEEAADPAYGDDYQEVVEDRLRHQAEERTAIASEYGLDPEELEQYYNDYYGGFYDGSYDEWYAENYDEEKALNDYMADMAHNKNIRYAVVYQDKLLYSNIEGYEEQTGKEWDGSDFGTVLPLEEYNFSLWYNREDDGKVRIVKDGREVDVYGDGIYGDDSLWYVPGYANFTLGESAKEARVFIAVAKNPQLYLVGDYGGYGVDQYGGRLYYMKLTRTVMHREFQEICGYLIASVILLVLSLLLYKSKRLADQKIADLSGKVYLEVKVFLFLFILLILAGNSVGVLSEACWKIENGFSSYYCWSGDITYEISRMFRAGAYLAAFFWLFYLAVLDWKGNRKNQKKPLFDMLKRKDLKYPLQKRLVRRQRIRVVIELVILMFAGTVGSVLCLLCGTAADCMEAYDYYGYGGAWSDWYYEWMYGSGVDSFVVVVVIMGIVFLGVFLGFMILDIVTLRKNRRLAEDIGALSDQIQAVREGNLTEDLQLSADTDLQEAAKNLNEIQKGMETALREQVKSERMKVDLVTNVSHDIKTPLTSIISYVELLRQEQDLPEHVKEFIQILGEKSERLRNIVQDVFEVSKATSGQLPIQMEVLDMGKLLRQTLADMNAQIEQSSFTMKLAIPEVPMPVVADGQRLYRVFQNLLQNALHYSLEGSRIYLTLTEEMERVVVRMKNTSSVELKSTKDFTERFVRGDESRTDGGSGLGLSIAKSFTQACGGELTVETDADLFTVTVSFQKAQTLPIAEAVGVLPAEEVLRMEK